MKVEKDEPINPVVAVIGLFIMLVLFVSFCVVYVNRDSRYVRSFLERQ